MVDEPRPLRRACDLCYKRKRRCDGNEETRCTRCTRKGLKCIFTPKQRTGPKPAARGGGAREQSYRRRARVVVVPGDEDDDPSAVRHTAASAAPAHHTPADSGITLSLCSYPEAGASCRSPTLKRPCLSPSPAVGIPGTRESAFLSSYFNCVGVFVYHVEERTTRAALFDLLSWRQEGGGAAADSTADDDDDSWHGELVLRTLSGPAVTRGGGGGKRDDRSVASWAAISLLWSAVGVGALAMGAEDDVIDGYRDEARAALQRCPSPAEASAAAGAAPGGQVNRGR